MHGPAIKALLIEDDPADAELVKRATTVADVHIDMHWSSLLAEGVDRLARDDFDIVLLGLSLPSDRGLSSVEAIRKADPEIPIVLLTSSASDDVALAALSLGVQELLTKQAITCSRLLYAVRCSIHRQQIQSEQRRLLGRLKKRNRRLRKLCQTAHHFVDNVSHEFRTPLTVIKEYTSLLREGMLGGLTGEQREFLDVVGDRADDLNNMVDDMLDSSRLESGILGLCRKSCDLVDIIDHIRHGLERKASVKGVVLDFAVDANLPPVFCDPDKVGRIIVNLAINAIKFCGDDGHVRLWAMPDSAKHNVVVGVSDNGPGIDETKCSEIFKRFKQLGTPASVSTKGFGLGLNIVNELVDLNFGQMDVASELGKGSTFSFTLPFAQPVEVLRRYLERRRRVRNETAVVSVVVADIARSVESGRANEVDSYFNYLLRPNDLAFRVDLCRWILILAVDENHLEKFFAEADQTRDEANRNRPQGPLPDIDMRWQGTWSVAQHGDQVLSSLEQILEHREISCAPLMPA